MVSEEVAVFVFGVFVALCLGALIRGLDRSCDRRGHEWRALPDEAVGRKAFVCRRCGWLS